MKMKLRLKLGRETKVRELDETCLVSSIYVVVCEIFPQLKCDFTLSLNKKDTLEVDKTLVSHGIVSGDLVYVVTSGDVDNVAPVCKPQLLSKEWSDSVQQTSRVGSQGNVTQTVRTGAASASHSSHAKTESRHVSAAQLSHECSNSDKVDTPTSLDQYSASNASEMTSNGQVISEMDTEEQITDSTVEKIDLTLVNRYLNEPMLCRESYGHIVPAVLSDMYQNAGITCSAEAMCTVLHVLMLETGYTTVDEKFYAATSSTNDQPASQTNPDNSTLPTSCDADSPLIERGMPGGWRDKPGQYCLYYKHVQPSCTEQSFVLTCFPMGSVLVVHGHLQGNEDNWSCCLNLNTKEFIKKTSPQGAGDCYQNLGKLSRVFKDAIALPMLQHYRTGQRLPPFYGIFAVSHEVKLKILGMLDVVGLLNMSETCKEFSQLCKDRYLWRHVYLKDFGNRNNNTLAQDWCRLYKQEYRLRKERRRIWKRNPVPMFGPPVLPSFGLPPPGPFHPGILNGDHDLDPVFGHYDRRLMPHSLIEQRSQPSSALFQPRFDPVGPLPGHNLQPGRGNGLRDRRGPFGGGLGGRRMF
ncbi:F-box only protein 7-like [Ylistrum balloti]|uniref:F-box only protein 7-like n=1 Tax=Ylistrum balloti TaxID=509963 RepID=UPI002905CF0C|nr:F-box only protein 7-like [Ylistrum balloti]